MIDSSIDQWKYAIQNTECMFPFFSHTIATDKRNDVTSGLDQCYLSICIGLVGSIALNAFGLPHFSIWLFFAT